MLKFLRTWWRDQTQERGVVSATFLLFRNLWRFLRDSTPERRRQRYGDMEYDWEHRVNTTSGTLGWRERLLGTFHSPYQPTDPALFQEMMSALPIQFDQFTFIDIGSGKGRTLLMASEYPFQKIIGVELLPELNQVAQENLRLYQSESQKCFALESACADATNFSFPAGPLVLYLFNPLPESGLRQMLINLDRSLTASPRPAYVLYHNPLLEHVLAGTAQLTRLSGTESYSLYRSSKTTRTH
jgi:SAM-dependent methyltransferase